MTDEERKKLCEALRSGPEDAIEIVAWMRMAANEIERLAEENAQLKDIVHRINCDLMDTQSDTEPDPTKVICPNCTHQFTAISVADQERLAEESQRIEQLEKDIEALIEALKRND